jgi:DNA (cytosine-5)-methyltransferase 1
MVFETVCTDLEGEGYEVRTFNIPAAGVQAPHRRERLWVVAHAKRFNERKSIRGSDETQSRIQEEHRQNDSASRESSRTGSVWGTNNGHEDMENSRRTLQQGTELSKKNENETREGNANIDQRSSSTSRSNVANTESIDSNVGERGEHQEEGDRQQQTRGKSGETMVDSSTGRRASQETEVQPGRYSSFDSSWWQSEPELGRVANGVQGRVHRLKSLGNSIVPKIVQEIGNAIIQAEKEKELEDIEARNGF